MKEAPAPVCLPRGWGLLPIAFGAIYAGHYVRLGRPANLLWACELASLCVGIGLLVRSPACHALGVLWLAMGFFFWIIYLAGGGEFLPAALLTHVGGGAVGLIGVRALGMPRQMWWKALALLVALQQICRWITPEWENVNLAFSVHPGFERIFPSYGIYFCSLVALCAAGFFVAERGFRRWVKT